MVGATVIQDFIVDLLHFFSADHKTCAKFLLSLPGNFNDHALLIETIFGELFHLPKPPYKLVYYAVIIGSLCKASTAIPPVVRVPGATSLTGLFVSTCR